MKQARIAAWTSSPSANQCIIEEAVSVLRKGLLIILPTDTVYGIAADPFYPDAIKRLYKAKGRVETKPVTLLAATLLQIEQYGAELKGAANELAQKYWPGPLTIVLRANNKFEGFRIPNHTIALSVIQAVGRPLRVTSANRSGEQPAVTAKRAWQTLGNTVALVLDAGSHAGGIPSTVIKIISGAFSILREGAIPEAEITLACRKLGLRPANAVNI